MVKTQRGNYKLLSGTCAYTQSFFSLFVLQCVAACCSVLQCVAVLPGVGLHAVTLSRHPQPLKRIVSKNVAMDLVSKNIYTYIYVIIHVYMYIYIMYTYIYTSMHIYTTY